MKTIHVKNQILGEGIPKIIVPVMGRTPAEAAGKCKAALEAGAELIELRADAFLSALGGADSGLPDLLEACRGAVPAMPILFTCRTAAEGGEWDCSPKEYAKVLECVLQSRCVDLIDIELARENAKQLLEEAHIRELPVILSFHSFTGTPPLEELRELLLKMEETGADLAKIACMPLKDRDVSFLLSLSAWASYTLKIPALVIAMGEKGAVSRIAGEIFGSPMSFACLSGEASAPGQLPAAALKEKLTELHLRRSPLVFLTGFMGSGKSTVGRELSAMTGLPLIEMDEEIERRSGRSVPEIFEEVGEQGFRDMETNLLAGLWQCGGAVVSCGGGAVLREENRNLMKALGKVILLETSPETILQRLTGESEGRPNIRGRMTIEGVSGLMEQRRKAYEASADITIRTDGLSPALLGRRICDVLQLPLA